MDFKTWFLREIGEGDLQKRKGSELFQDPAMEIAMYMLYRMAYDPVSARDYEDDVKSHGSEEQAKSAGVKKGVAWSHSEWTYPSSGGTRSPEWTFYGIFPNEADLSVIRQVSGDVPANLQTVADQLLAQGEPKMSYAGGLSYRTLSDSVKLTGSWGGNGTGATLAKMRAMTFVVHEAQVQGKEIFTGMDKHLKAMVDAMIPKLDKFHKKGIVPSPQLDLHTPPAEVVPLLYQIITNHPAASGGGSWKGYDADTGAMKYQLSGSGLRDKYAFGNSVMWKKQIQKMLQQSGIKASMLGMAGAFGGGANPMVVGMVNQAIQKQMPSAKPLGPTGVSWLLQMAQ